MVVKSYRDLEVYQLAFDLAVEVDRVSKTLPKHEMYETGSQLRRSAKSIPANIAEGFGRRRYKQDYIRFLVYALASCDETRVHLDMLYQTKSLQEEPYQKLTQQQYTWKAPKQLPTVSHQTPPGTLSLTSQNTLNCNQYLASSFQQPASSIKTNLKGDI